MPPAQAPVGAPQPKRYDGEDGQPKYDPTVGGHYGASAAIAAGGRAPPAETFTGHWANVRSLLSPPLSNEMTADAIATRSHKGSMGSTEIS